MWGLAWTWPSHWSTCHPSSDGSSPPPLSPLSVWSGVWSLGPTPPQTSRAPCALRWGPCLPNGKEELECLYLCVDQTLVFGFAHACGADDVINDFSRDRLGADEADGPSLVHQSVKFSWFLQHRVLGVTCWWVGHVWMVFLLTAVHPVAVLYKEIGQKEASMSSLWYRNTTFCRGHS